MKDAQKPDHVILNQLIARIRDGRFVIPDFQREFEWEPWDIQELMRSIFLDYYIGSLLLWKGKPENFEALACEPIYGFADGSGHAEHIVLDGQQRLTAMHYAFFAPDVPLPNRVNRAFYYIRADRFMDEDYDEAFHYDWYSKRWARMLSNPELQYAEHIFPLGVLGDGGWALPNWVQGYARYWEDRVAGLAAGVEQTAGVEPEAEQAPGVETTSSVGDDMTEQEAIGHAEAARRHAESARAFGEYLKELTEQYQISFIELDRDIGVDKVCDIFTQINSRGVRLDVFDLMNAMLKPKDVQLKHLWRAAKPRLEFVDTGKMNVYILQVMSILRQSYCSPKYLYFLLPGHEKPVRASDGTRSKEVLVSTPDEFEKRWHRAVTALERAIKLLQHPQEFGAISSKYLPYPSILPVFAALQATAHELPDHQRLDAQRKIRHWYWASVFTSRYSGSVESTSARDYLDVKAWFDSDAAEPALIQEFELRFRNLDLRSTTKSGSSIYNGIFNLLVLNGARDWNVGTVPSHEDLDDHHIVPASWGRKHLDGDRIHTVLNRTPLTSETNRRVIADRLPNVYLREMIEHNGEERVRAILASHLISPEAQAILLRDPFTAEDYDAFVSERQRSIQEAIETLLVKERLDLSPHLRELDADVEAVELALRGDIAASLEGDAQALPGHVRQRAYERIQRAAKKNPAMDAARYETLDGYLEFCDLRELQDTITNKTLWPRFEGRYGTKETFIGKLDRLAELRNAIRHSRSVDEITKKEGEAAVLWFQKVLGDAETAAQELS